MFIVDEYFPKDSTEVYYKDIETRVRIITKEEFYNALDNAIAFNKGWLEQNSRAIENKEQINVVE